MGAPYATQSAVNYNANPPADDGSTSASNQVKYSTTKTKLADPVKTLADAINAQTLAAFGKIIGGASVSSTAVSYAVVSGDQGKLVRATASGITITFPDATAVGSPFVFALLNSSSGNITIAGASTQTINGSTSLTMGAGDGYTAHTDGTNWFVTGRKTGVLPRGYIDGCTLANGADTTNDITIAAGVVRDSTNTVDITVAAMTTGKQLDANWAPGDAAGMRNSAAGIANGTYHIYAVAKADGTQDIYAHTSATIATVLTALQAETGGASYVYAQMIGSIVRASAAILQFTQNGDNFKLKTPVLDIDVSNAGTSAVTRTLASIPTGIKVEALIIGQIAGASNGGACVYFSDLAQADIASTGGTGFATISSPNATPYTGAAPIRVFTNTSAQIRTRQSASGASDLFRITSEGWIHPRGKNG